MEFDISHLPEKFIVFDLETTGLDSRRHKIIEIAAIKFDRFKKAPDQIAFDTQTFQSLVKIDSALPKIITNITGITEDMLASRGVPIEEALSGFLEFVGDLRLVSFNAMFDFGFLNAAVRRARLKPTENPFSCALEMARRAWPGLPSYKLIDLAKSMRLDFSGHHRALKDCELALIVYLHAASWLRCQE